MSTLEAAFSQLPAPIQDKLGSMIRRVRRLLFIRGLCATLAIALACLLVIMLIDASMTLFSPTSRWILSLTGLTITLIAAWWFLFRPLSRRFTLTQMARIIEIRHPELQERISTAVELLSSDDPESIKGSEELISAVVDSAIVDVEAVDPKTEFKPARAAKFAGAALALALVIGISLLVWPAQSWTLLQRAVAPFLDIGNAYADTIEVDPGDIRIAKGEPVTVTLKAKHRKLKRAEIRSLLPDGTESVERMTLLSEDEDGTKLFSITFPQVEEDFSYRLRAGSALTRYFNVETVVPPAISRITIEYDYPEYTALEPRTETNETGEIRAVANTRVTLKATPSKDIETSRLLLNKGTDLGTPETIDDQLQWSFDLKPGMNGHWQVELTDSDGFTNQPLTYPLEVLPDKSPSVIVTSPVEGELRLRPTERLTVISEIIEDFGFRDAVFLITPIGADRPQEAPIDLPSATGAAETYVSNATLNLGQLSLNENQKRIGVQVLVRDSRPENYDGPGIGLSEPFYITLDTNAKTLAQQAVEAKKKEVEEQLRKAKQELEKARNDMRQAEQELKRTDDVSERAMRPLKQFSEHTENARKELDEVAASLNDTFLQEQADKAKSLAEEQVAEAREKADLIPVTDSKQDRIKDAQEARKQIEEAIKGVDEIAKAMRDANDEFEMISKLNDLANRQQELANRADDMAEDAAKREVAMEEAQREFTQSNLEEQQRQQMEQFRNQQEQVQQQLGEMLKDNAEALDEVLGVQQERAEQLADAADALAREQKDLKELNQEATQSNESKQDALRGQLIDHLQKEQEKLAGQMQQQSEIPGTEPQQNPENSENTPASPSPEEKLAEASNQAAETAEQLGQEDLESAAESANQARDSLTEAAKSSEPESANQSSDPAAEPADPEAASSESAPGDPNMAEAATAEPGEAPATNESSPSETPNTQLPSLGDLAERQETLAEQIEMVRDGDLQEALSSIEAQLQADAEALRDDTRALEETLDNLSQNTAESAAKRAEQALNQGVNEAGDAAQHLSNAEQMQDQAVAKNQVDLGEISQPAQLAMQRAAQEQQQAAQALERASGALTASAKSMGQTRDGLDPSDAEQQVADGEEMAEGFNDVTESAQSQDAQQAAQQSQEAADSLQQLAQSAMKKLGSEGQQSGMAPSDQPNANPELAGEPDGSLNLNESGMKTADADGTGVPAELEALGISAEDWSRFKGALTGGNAAGIETELPAEYRELVGRYFQVIAKEAGKE